MSDANIITLKPRPAPDLTTNQKLALLAKYEDALCRIADAPEARLSFADLRRLAAEALGVR